MSPGIVVAALGGAFAILLSTTYHASTTKNDHLSWGPILFFVLIGLVISAILNIFIGSTIFSIIISSVALVLFSLYIIYDIQTILRTDIQPLDAAINLYINILNIFISLLNILNFDWD